MALNTKTIFRLNPGIQLLVFQNFSKMHYISGFSHQLHLLNKQIDSQVPEIAVYFGNIYLSEELISTRN